MTLYWSHPELLSSQQGLGRRLAGREPVGSSSLQVMLDLSVLGVKYIVKSCLISSSSMTYLFCSSISTLPINIILARKSDLVSSPSSILQTQRLRVRVQSVSPAFTCEMREETVCRVKWRDSQPEHRAAASGFNRKESRRERDVCVSEILSYNTYSTAPDRKYNNTTSGHHIRTR